MEKEIKKLVRVFLVLGVFLLCISGIALASDVNLSIDNGGITTYKLDNMSIATDGTITMNVLSTDPSSGFNLNLSLNNLPTGTINKPYGPVSVTMTASGGSNPYTYNCAANSCISGISASASGNICTVSGTPTKAGNCSVRFSATDATQTTISKTTIFSVTSSQPPPNTTINIGPRYPSVKDDDLVANGTKQYHFILDKNVTYTIMQMSSSDWSTNSDMIVSTNSTPANCSDMVASYSKGTNGLWYGPSMNSNERIVIPITRQAGSIFYVTICNQSNTKSTYTLFWTSD